MKDEMNETFPMEIPVAKEAIALIKYLFEKGWDSKSLYIALTNYDKLFDSYEGTKVPLPGSISAFVSSNDGWKFNSVEKNWTLVMSVTKVCRLVKVLKVIVLFEKSKFKEITPIEVEKKSVEVKEEVSKSVEIVENVQPTLGF